MGFYKLGVSVHYYILPSPSNTVYSIDLSQHFTVQERSGKYVYHHGTYSLALMKNRVTLFQLTNKKMTLLFWNFFCDKFPIISTLLKQRC